jgi:hypothetical protein
MSKVEFNHRAADLMLSKRYDRVEPTSTRSNNGDTCMPRLETIKQFVAKNAESGLYPATEYTLRGIHRYRDVLGVSEAFVQIGKRITVDREHFYQLLAEPKKSRPNARKCSAKPPNKAPETFPGTGTA